MASNKAANSKKNKGKASGAKNGAARPGPARPKPAPARSAAGKSSAARRPAARASVAGQGMSLDRKLDITGIVLVFLGVITGLSLFSAQQSPLLGTWVSFLRQFAGWGVPALPLGFMAAGLWLVLRKFGDRLPRVEPERIAGGVLLYLALLATLHFVGLTRLTSLPAGTDPGYPPEFVLVDQGKGGGLLGALLLYPLIRALGDWGTVVLLAAVWLIGFTFAAGLSLPELVVLAGRALKQLRPPQVERQLPLPATPPASPPAPPPAPAPAASPPPPSPAVPSQAATGTSPATAPAAPAPNSATQGVPAAAVVPIVIGNFNWELPAVAGMLEPGTEGGATDELDRRRANMIEATLASFGAPVRVVEVNRGPTITQFGVEPDFVEQRGGKRTKVKVGKIAALADDLALALSAQSIRIEAPVPGKGYVGIEVPNAETALVALRDVMEAESFDRLKGTLRLGLGQDVSGGSIAADLTRMPHLLIAGTTGSGKSVCVNAIIACLLLQNTPDDLKFVMVDPKRVELTAYNGIPHLLSPVVVELERVVAALQWVTREMDERYRKFARTGVRNIADYNARFGSAAPGSLERKLPYLVIIIDELADLMMLAPDETERTITRLAQLARATGIHLIIATQRPSVDVVTGLIKANFPARIAFAVASGVDSRVILDQPGAERLLGRGDMLFQSPDAATPLRMQGVFVSDAEIHRLVDYWNAQRLAAEAQAAEAAAAAAEAAAAAGLPAGGPVGLAPVDPLAAAGPAASGPIGHVPLPQARAYPPPGAAPDSTQWGQQPLWDSGPFAQVETRADGEDELLEEAIKAVREMKKASISMLQRRLRIGYTRSARLIDALEERGIIGPAESGAKPREVIDYGTGAAPGADLPDNTATGEETEEADEDE